MNIFLKVMKTVALSVKQSDTVSDLKTLFREKEGIYEHFQELYFSGERLNDEQTLIDCGIQENSTLNLYVENSEVLKLFITVISKEKTVEIEAKSKETIENIKSKVCSKEGILSHNFSLFYAGKQLKNSKTLASIGINGNSTLQLVFNPTDILSINVQLPNDEVIKTEAKLLSIVADFKAYIGSIAGLPVSDHCLLYNGKELEDSKTLACYDLKEDSVLKIVPCKIQIFVRGFNEKIVTISVHRNETVGVVMEESFRKLCMQPKKSYFLEYGGNRLEDGRNLTSYGIQKESTLHMMMFSTLFRPDII